jgi:NAD(P)-dependent dehydrogenase (short-subunit alcohol dehydrogenase family)
VETDVTDPEQCERLVSETMERFGRVDILVNNAGVGTAVPATRETPEQFRKVIDLNLNGSYWMAQACGRVMEPGSAIVNISSIVGLTTAALPQAAYSASKGALISLTKSIAQRYGRDGVRANVVCPGFVDTPMTEFVRGQVKPEEMIRPEDIAESVRFLLRTSPACLVPEIVFARPADELGV